MCYTNGPRCSKEGLKAYQKAQAKGNPEEIKRAKLEYYTTTEGISRLRTEGHEELANKFQQRRTTLIATSKTIDAERAARKERQAKFEAAVNAAPEAPRKAWAQNIKPVFKTRKAKVAVIAGTGFLAASLLSGCSTSNQADYAAVCQDAKSQQRVSDDKCSDGSTGHSSAYLWYFMAMNSKVPAVGSPLTGGTTQLPEGKTFSKGINPKGQSVTKSGFGSGGVKGTGRGGGGGMG